MFGKNTRIGLKTFEHSFTQNTSVVTSIFPTLQGEGPYSGRRCVFVRFAYCNLDCPFCDTYFDNGHMYRLDELVKSIYDTRDAWVEKNIGSKEKSKGAYSDWGIVFTGGEPLLQQNTIINLIKVLTSGSDSDTNPFHWFQMETNGTLPIKKELSDICEMVCSPKIVESEGKQSSGKIPKSNHDKIAYLKFVVSSDETSPYHKVPEWAKDISYNGKRVPIYVSPMNMYLAEPMKNIVKSKFSDSEYVTNSEERERISFWEEGILDMNKNRLNHEHAAKLCMENGYILSLQTHLLASLP
jgi:organic radical activating enzyme